MKLDKVTETLTNRYPPPHRLFGCTESEYGSNEWRRRRLFANIIVGGSKDEDAVLAATQLFELTTFEELSNRDNYSLLRRQIADMLEIAYDIRFAGKKADYILNTAYALNENHNGIVPDTFEELTAFPGVGRHAAAVVLALAFDQPTFGVDLHVRRIAKRMKLVDSKATDRKIEKALMASPKAGHLSRAFVEFAKDICGYRPACKRCPFQNDGCDPSILK